MDKIKIITDSASDIPFEREKELDIRVIPFYITIDNKTYKERADFSPEEFYKILDNCHQVPTTSQINASVFENEFKKLYNENYNKLIYISISSSGSNTFNSAVIARKNFFKNNPDAESKISIHIIDSKCYSIGYGYPVMKAAIKAKNGVSCSDIIEYLTDWFDNINIYFGSYSLKYMRKSGRITGVTAFAGEMMGLRPIIAIKNGEINIIQKIRGNDNIIPSILHHANQNMIPRTPYSITIGDIDKENDFIKQSEKIIGYKPSAIVRTGASICVHSGPQVIGIAIKSKPHN